MQAAKIRLGIFMVAAAGAIAQPSHARQGRALFATPRDLSMGGALSATADGYESLYSNPAGLALVDDWYLRLPELLTVEASPKALTIFNKIKGTPSAQIPSKLVEFDGDAASLNTDLLGLGWYRPRMAVAINALSLNTTLRVRTPSLLFSRARVRATADSGLSLGYAHPFLANHLRAGIAFRPFLMRVGLEDELNAAQISQLFGSGNTSDIVEELKALGGAGWGMDLDLGVQGNLDPLPVLGYGVVLKGGAVLKNLAGNKFSHRVFTDKATGAPPALEREGSVGVAATVQDLGVFTPTLSFEYQHIGQKTYDFIEHLAVGTEFRFRPKTWFHTALRGHYNAGNLGGGLMLKLWKGELELGTYAVNLGKGAGVGVDRRLYVQLAAMW